MSLQTTDRNVCPTKGRGEDLTHPFIPSQEGIMKKDLEQMGEKYVKKIKSRS